MFDKHTIVMKYGVPGSESDAPLVATLLYFDNLSLYFDTPESDTKLLNLKNYRILLKYIKCVLPPLT